MDIRFIKLQKSHFSLLLKWLNTEHVKKWWDKEIFWTKELIEKKYSTYALGYKKLGQIKKPIHAFIIDFNTKPIGYIQYYNKYNFPPKEGYELKRFPKSLGAIDLYIGELDFIGKGIGVKVINKFLDSYVFKEFHNCFVGPEIDNISAIKAYERSGFKTVKRLSKENLILMLKPNL